MWKLFGGKWMHTGHSHWRCFDWWLEDELFGDQWCVWNLLQKQAAVCRFARLAAKNLVTYRDPQSRQSINRVAVVLQQNTDFKCTLRFFMINAWSISDLFNYDRAHMCEWASLGKSRKSVWLFENVVLQMSVSAESLLSHRKKHPRCDKVLWAIVRTASPTNDSMGLGPLECSKPFEAKSHAVSDPYHPNILNHTCNLIYCNYL